jgi:hypothetical protein
MAMQLLRGHIINDISEEQADWYEKFDARLEFLDRKVWNALINPCETPNIVNYGLCLWAQMAETLSETVTSPNSPPTSLCALQAICQEVRPAGNPVLEKLLHANRMFVSVYMDRFDDAKESATSLISMFEKYPILLTLTRQPIATHILLDSAELLNVELSKRVAIVRRALLQVPRWAGEASLLLTLYKCILDRILLRIPRSVLTAPDTDGDDTDDELCDFEGYLAAEDATLMRDSESLLSVAEEWVAT